MNKNTMLAFFVWAIDVDALSLPVTKCWEMFQRDAWGMYKAYTNPSDELYCPNLVGKNPIEVMTDYTLTYAKMWVLSGIKNYGKYDELIKNYKR
jgi:hypothetical protein